LIYQFGFPTLIIGDDQGRTHESTEWLESKGVDVVQLRSPRLSTMFSAWTIANPEVWAEDAGRWLAGS
jgi:hypothetical protein